MPALPSRAIMVAGSCCDDFPSWDLHKLFGKDPRMITDLAVARAMVARVPSWFHSFELLPGLVTPGRQVTRPREHLDHLGIAEDLRGTRALEIGTWDGPVAFELERRGATVVALDIQDPSKTGFNTAKAILGSRVDYVQGSVYDLTRLLPSQFDLVVYFGVYYHLKNPVLAFEQIAAVMTDTASLAFEGECLINYVEDGAGNPTAALPVELLASTEVPVALFYAGAFKSDDTNWFVPNLACLREWLKAAGLSMRSHYLYAPPATSPPIQRVGGLATKTRVPPIEHRTV